MTSAVRAVSVVHESANRAAFIEHAHILGERCTKQNQFLINEHERECCSSLRERTVLTSSADFKKKCDYSREREWRNTLWTDVSVWSSSGSLLFLYNSVVNQSNEVKTFPVVVPTWMGFHISSSSQELIFSNYSNTTWMQGASHTVWNFVTSLASSSRSSLAAVSPSSISLCMTHEWKHLAPDTSCLSPPLPLPVYLRTPRTQTTSADHLHV